MNQEPECQNVPIYQQDIDWLKSTRGSFDLTDRIHEVITIYRRRVLGEKV